MERKSSALEPQYPVASRTRILTDHFYAWDRRLRGYECWPYPVELEPTFIPFRYGLSRKQPVTDDARKDTFLSALARRVGLLSDQASQPRNVDAEEEQIDIDTLEPYLYAPEGALIELQLALPPKVEYAKGVVIQFLSGLVALKHPFCFEVIGTETQITMQLACREPDVGFVRSQLDTLLPEVVIRQEPQYLERHFDAGAEEWVGAVGFGLRHECVIPIETPNRFDPDPLNGIVASLSLSEAREAQVLQIMCQPVVNDWSSELKLSVLDADGSPYFSDAPELVGYAREKAASPLYATTIRIGARAASCERTEMLLKGLGSAVVQFNGRGKNDLVPLVSEGYPPYMHVRDLCDRVSKRSGMLLNVDEITGFVHLPMRSVTHPKLLRSVGRTKEAPRLSLGHDLVLGQNEHRGHRQTVSLSVEQRMRHAYVIGASGTGKSTLLLNMLIQDIQNGLGIALLDPHGDLVDAVLRHIPEHRIADVILLDPSDEEYPIGLNIFDAHSEAEKILLASDLAHVFRRLSTSWGDQMNAVLANGILAMLEHPADNTLVTLRRFLVEQPFRKEFLKDVRDEEIRYYWEKEYSLLSGKPQAPVLTRLDTFLRPKLIRNMVAQKRSAIDFASVQDNKKILLAKLSQGGIGEENSYLLGTLLVTSLYQAAQSRQSIAPEDRIPFYIYIDEFQNFITPSMEAILSGARKYNVALTLAHQDLQQLASRDRDVASSVLSNPYTRICFRLGDADARTLARGLSYFTAEDLQSLGIGDAIARIEQAQYDFNLATTMPPEQQKDVAKLVERIIAESRNTYATPRERLREILDAESKTAAAQANEHDATATPQPTRRATRTEPKEKRPTTKRRKTAQPVAQATEGRGGAQHTYLQSLIKKVAMERGFKATVEDEVLGGVGSVDVALSRGDRRIACEISVTTSTQHELENVQKCIAAGFDYVIMLSHEQKKLISLQKRAREAFDDGTFRKLRFLVPNQFIEFLDDMQAKVRERTSRVRGYNVKVSYKTLSAEEQKTRSDAIAKLIVQSLKRMKE